MAIGSVIRAAVAVSAASALSVKDQVALGSDVAWSRATNLPRTVLVSKHADVTKCGEDFPGYFKMDGLYWLSEFATGARNRTACKDDCDAAKNCIGFTALKSKTERMRCSLHKGLQQQVDHRAVSFSKCQIKGFACQNGFQFSHAGTWRSGKQIEELDDEALDACAKACKKKQGLRRLHASRVKGWRYVLLPLRERREQDRRQAQPARPHVRQVHQRPYR